MSRSIFSFPRLPENLSNFEFRVLLIISSNSVSAIIFSNNIAYPELTLGFNHYIHKTKDIWKQIREKHDI